MAKHGFTIDGLNCAVVSREGMLRMREGGIDALNLTSVRPWADFATSMSGLARNLDVIKANADIACIATSAAEIEAAAKASKVAYILGAQNSLFVQEDLNLLSVCQQLGMRILQPTYMEQNKLGSGVLAENPAGLTPLGFEWVERMNALKLLIDLSHVGYQTAFDCAKHSKVPVSISHANARALVDSPRNIPDELVKAIGATGGTVGATPWPPITMRERQPTLDDWAAHIAHFVNLIGIDHVSFGSDLSEGTYTSEEAWQKSFGPKGMYPTVTGMMGPWFQFTNRFTQGFDSLSKTGNIWEALGRRFKPSEVEKIMGKNLLRIYREVWGA